MIITAASFLIVSIVCITFIVSQKRLNRLSLEIEADNKHFNQKVSSISTRGLKDKV